MNGFKYNTGERFADIEILRYRLDGFEQLSLRQKVYIYCLAEAALWGRDIVFDQNGRYNLLIRRLLETIVQSYPDDSDEFGALTTYLKRVWFSNGIYHHYGMGKFQPNFTPDYLKRKMQEAELHYDDDLMDVIFNPARLPKRVNKADGQDIVLTSACNFYQGVNQQEAEDYYRQSGHHPLNATLCRKNGLPYEDIWRIDGKYGEAIKHICEWLAKAMDNAENKEQKEVISKLISYYRSGDPTAFDDYSITWVKAVGGRVDFINGFIEVYGDPLGLKGTWEGLVHYKDLIATQRAQTICRAAQWFEDHSPVDPRFRKTVVKGVTANVVQAAMLGGDEYPSTAIGINLPNAEWIRAEYGSKSITIGNLTEAYNKAAHGNGFREEFVCDKATLDIINRYGDECDDLHTDLHECVGHGSGQLLPGVSGDALKNYGNTIEEARADLYALYYIADEKMLELRLLTSSEAYKSNYYTYMMNGLMTQLIRVCPGEEIEEAHMRNRSLIARWCLEKGSPRVMEITKRDNKHYVVIHDYPALRSLIGSLLAEIGRIKSEGDYKSARQMVETYGVKVDPAIHHEALERYKCLNLAPYKGFLNPRMTPVRNNDGAIIDISLDYSETYSSQMLRYSNDYATGI